MGQLKVYLGVRLHRFLFVHSFSGVEIHVQDGVLLSLPFADSCVLANRIRSQPHVTGGDGGVGQAQYVFVICRHSCSRR